MPAPLPGQTQPYWNDSSLEQDPGRAQQLQRADGRHDLLRLGGARRRRGRPGRARRCRRSGPSTGSTWARSPGPRRAALTSYYAHWDDHEFINDFPKSENIFPEAGGDVAHQRQDALQERASRRSATTTPSATRRRPGIYRSFRWGKNLRDLLPRRALLPQPPAPTTAATCDNPPGSGIARPGADRAAERAATRSRALVPSSATPVAAGLPRRDQRPEPDDARQRPAATVQAGDQAARSATFKVSSTRSRSSSSTRFPMTAGRATRRSGPSSSSSSRTTSRTSSS